MSLDRYGRSDLHYTPQHKPEEEQAELAERLITEGCDINHQDARGWVPLHFAAQEWSAPVASLLIQRGANVDIQDEHGNTPLSTAVFNSRGRGELIRILLDAGADPDIANNHGVSPRSLADTIANFDVKQHIPSKA
ncbi:MAG: ankyrin repeat domain-containing protein [Verrucomicrobiales bacterium]|nr:ankyrin repeat domain-containing protein [Verrucomicrobiales bacterium]